MINRWKEEKKQNQIYFLNLFCETMQCNGLGFMLQVRLLDTLWCFDRNLLNCTWGRLEQEIDG